MTHSSRIPRRVHRGVITAGVVGAALVMTAACGKGSSKTDTDSSGSAQASASSSAAGGSADAKLKITAVTHASQGDSFWAVVDNGMTEAAKNLNVDLDIQVSGGDPAKQAQLVTTAISKKVDGILVTLPNPDAMAAPVKAAQAGGIPVISFNSGGSAYAKMGIPVHIGEDEGIAGEGVGQRLTKESFKKVLCVQQEQGNVGLTNYCNGIHKTFKGTLKTIFVNGTKDVAGSAATIKAAVAGDPSIDGVFVLSPDIAPAAVQAVKDANSKAKVAGWNLSKGVIADLQNGSMEFADDSEPYLQGYLAVQSMALYKRYLLVAGGGQPILTGPTFVDKTNAKQVEDLTAKGIR